MLACQEKESGSHGWAAKLRNVSLFICFRIRQTWMCWQAADRAAKYIWQYRRAKLKLMEKRYNLLPFGSTWVPGHSWEKARLGSVTSLGLSGREGQEQGGGRAHIHIRWQRWASVPQIQGLARKDIWIADTVSTSPGLVSAFLSLCLLSLITELN